MKIMNITETKNACMLQTLVQTMLFSDHKGIVKLKSLEQG